MTSKQVCLNIEQKSEILKELDKGMSTKTISKKYNISVHTVSKIKRQHEVIRHEDTLKTMEGNVRKRKSMKQPANQELENRIYDWFKQKRSQGIPISGLIVQEKALQINTELGSDTSRDVVCIECVLLKKGKNSLSHERYSFKYTPSHKTKGL